MCTSLYWLQCGSCGGDSMSLLNATSPNLVEMLGLLNIEVLWHPSFSNGSASEHQRVIEKLLSGQQELGILCIEGTIIQGPGGTGMYEAIGGKPKKEIVSALANRAHFVVAIGTCASFGGIGAEGEVEAIGTQFLKWNKGGFLGESFVARSGLPVINLPGCPCHHDVVIGTLTALTWGVPMALTELNTPLEWYGMLCHQGCTRNEYHEYRVEEHDFGEKGCLFFYMGCQGPLTYAPCNRTLWLGRSSKTRRGVPCFACTRPDFPQPYPFFQTRSIEDIPLDLPDGVDRAHYLAYKGMAAAAAPQRLKDRKTRI